MTAQVRKARRAGFGRFRGLLDPAPLHALRGAVVSALARHGVENIVAIQCEIMVLPLVAELREHPALLGAASALLDAPAEPIHADVLRLVPPGAPPTPPHRDAGYIARTPLWIAWIPLADCPLERGPLVMNPSVFPRILPCALGDAVFFSSTTEHATLPNTSSLTRLSIDFRYGIAPPPQVR